MDNACARGSRGDGLCGPNPRSLCTQGVAFEGGHVSANREETFTVDANKEGDQQEFQRWRKRRGRPETVDILKIPLPEGAEGILRPSYRPGGKRVDRVHFDTLCRLLGVQLHQASP